MYCENFNGKTKVKYVLMSAIAFFFLLYSGFCEAQDNKASGGISRRLLN